VSPSQEINSGGGTTAEESVPFGLGPGVGVGSGGDSGEGVGGVGASVSTLGTGTSCVRATGGRAWQVS